jgi:hypothetical protein
MTDRQTQTTMDRAESDAPDRDPTQLVPPELDTGMKLDLPYIGQTPARNFRYALPGIGVSGLGTLGALSASPPEMTGPLLGGGALLAAGGYRIAASTDYDETTGLDRLRWPLRHRWLKRALPFTDEDAAARTHGIARVLRDGTAEMLDGRLVGMVRLEGRNTDLQTDEEARPMIGRLRTALDEDAAGVPFRLYSTSLDLDPEAVTAPYRRAWHETYTGESWRWMREYLRTLTEWERRVSRELWESREWRHYAVVSVAPADVDLPAFHDGQDVDETRLAAVRRRRMQAELRDRLETVAGAFRQTAGVDTSPVGPAELAALVARRWAGTYHNFDPEDVTDAVDAAVWPHAGEPSGSDDPATEAPHRPGAISADDELDAQDRDGASAAVTAPEPGTTPPPDRAAPDGGETARDSR